MAIPQDTPLVDILGQICQTGKQLRLTIPVGQLCGASNDPDSVTVWVDRMDDGARLDVQQAAAACSSFLAAEHRGEEQRCLVFRPPDAPEGESFLLVLRSKGATGPSAVAGGYDTPGWLRWASGSRKEDYMPLRQVFSSSPAEGTPSSGTTCSPTGLAIPWLPMPACQSKLGER